MSHDGLAYGTSGNLSVRDETHANWIWITPSGVDFDTITAEDMVAVQIADHQVMAGDLKPSSEVPMHTGVYAARKDIQAIVHTHSEYATIFAVLGRPIAAVHYQLAWVGDGVPVAPYATYGTDALAHNVLETLGEHGRAVLMQNHGVMAVAQTLDHAYQYAKDVEWTAKLYYRTLCIGQPQILSPDQMEAARQQFAHYGQEDR
ncbi:MAG: class II aldolase/adducin family protein, partial [Firmicutes bacterium]|nr:class II aldolase/adducin family protein [Bacillota bacterium]